MIRRVNPGGVATYTRVVGRELTTPATPGEPTVHDEFGEAIVGTTPVTVLFATSFADEGDYVPGIVYACSADGSYLVRARIVDRTTTGLSLVADEEGARVSWQARQRLS